MQGIGVSGQLRGRAVEEAEGLAGRDEVEVRPRQTPHGLPRLAAFVPGAVHEDGAQGIADPGVGFRDQGQGAAEEGVPGLAAEHGIVQLVDAPGLHEQPVQGVDGGRVAEESAIPQRQVIAEPEQDAQGDDRGREPARHTVIVGFEYGFLADESGIREQGPVVLDRQGVEIQVDAAFPVEDEIAEDIAAAGRIARRHALQHGGHRRHGGGQGGQQGGEVEGPQFGLGGQGLPIGIVGRVLVVDGDARSGIALPQGSDRQAVDEGETFPDPDEVEMVRNQIGASRPPESRRFGLNPAIVPAFSGFTGYPGRTEGAGQVDAIGRPSKGGIVAKNNVFYGWPCPAV